MRKFLTTLVVFAAFGCGTVNDEGLKYDSGTDPVGVGGSTSVGGTTTATSVVGTGGATTVVATGGAIGMGGTTAIPAGTGGAVAPPGTGGAVGTGGMTTVSCLEGEVKIDASGEPVTCSTVFGQLNGHIVCRKGALTCEAAVTATGGAASTGGMVGTGGATTVVTTVICVNCMGTGGAIGTGGTTVDATPPDVGNVSAIDFVANALGSFMVEATDNVMVVLCELILDDMNMGGMNPPSGDQPVLVGNGGWGTTWMFSAAGLHKVAARCRDAVGNTTTSKPVVFTVRSPISGTGGVMGTGGTTSVSCVQGQVIACPSGTQTCQPNGTFGPCLASSNGGTSGTGGTVGTGGSVGTGGTSSTGGTTGTDQPCWADGLTLVCESKWVLNEPTYSDLKVWSSPQGAFVMTSAAKINGTYRWSIADKSCGVYNAWYTCQGCDNTAANGASYGWPANIGQISTAGKQWLTCPSPGYDIRFQKNCSTNTLVPAGCGMGI